MLTIYQLVILDFYIIVHVKKLNSKFQKFKNSQ